MAIATAAAIGLGAAALGSGVSAISANKASKRAAQTSSDNTASNNALARDIYGQNREALNPFMQRGNVAGNQINALLGLGGPQVQGGPANVGAVPGYGQPNALSQFQPAGQGYGLGDTPGYNYGGMSWDQFQSATDGMSAEDMRYQTNALRTQGAVPQSGGMSGGPLFTANGTIMSPTTTPGYGDWVGANIPGASPTAGATGQVGQTAQQAAEGAFDIFRNSTGYQFRLGEGMDAVTSAYAGIGGLQSGAAMRGINEYGQNFASNEFGNYMNALGGQQAVGAGAASSLAGVGQNYANTVINSNNYNTQNQMAAQLGKQNVFGNMLGTVGGGALGFLSGGK